MWVRSHLGIVLCSHKKRKERERKKREEKGKKEEKEGREEGKDVYRYEILSRTYS